VVSVTDRAADDGMATGRFVGGGVDDGARGARPGVVPWSAGPVAGRAVAGQVVGRAVADRRVTDHVLNGRVPVVGPPQRSFGVRPVLVRRDPAPWGEDVRGRVLAAYAESRVPVPQSVHDALRRGSGWSWFATRMFALDLSARTRGSLQEAFRRAEGRTGASAVDADPADVADVAVARRGANVPDLVAPMEGPARPTADTELQATTVGEFLVLLRRIRERSGLTVPRVAARTGGLLPRSQAYTMVDAGRTKLPGKVEQVRAFAWACGLPGHQVDRVVRLWAELREVGGVDDVARRRGGGEREAVRAAMLAMTGLRRDLEDGAAVPDQDCRQVDGSGESPDVATVLAVLARLRSSSGAPLLETNAGVAVAAVVLTGALGKHAVGRLGARTWRRREGTSAPGRESTGRGTGVPGDERAVVDLAG